MRAPGSELKTAPIGPWPTGTGPLMLRWPNAAHARASGTGRFGSRPKAAVTVMSTGI